MYEMISRLVNWIFFARYLNIIRTKTTTTKSIGWNVRTHWILRAIHMSTKLREENWWEEFAIWNHKRNVYASGTSNSNERYQQSLFHDSCPCKRFYPICTHRISWNKPVDSHCAALLRDRLKKKTYRPVHFGSLFVLLYLHSSPSAWSLNWSLQWKSIFQSNRLYIYVKCGLS